MISDKEKANIQQFYDAILKLETSEECEKFYDDVTTIKELIDMGARLQVAKMLDEGKVFNDISKETGASSATISRVNKCLGYGPGGYRLILDRLKGE